MKRALGFAAVAIATACALVLGTQSDAPAQQPRGSAPRPARPTPPNPRRPPTAKPTAADAAAPAPTVESTDAGTAAPPVAYSSDAGAVQVTKLDGGQIIRFGELEIEGRLKSPQLVYFLRRVRAEFAAGDLGHRSFMRELSETKKDPSFE
jgi:hypothetical protein